MFLAYTNNGFLAGVAGLVCLARFTSAFPNAGTGFEMDAIAACFIGGASAYGGIGTVPGALIGALIMGMLNLGMSITGVDQFMQQVTKGLVLLVAVAIDVVSKNRFGFDQAAQFASWVKELFRPGSREKPIRTKLAGVIAAILGAIILAAGIYGFVLFPALNAACGLLELVKTAAGNKESGIIFTSEQMRQLALVNYRILATVLGGLGIISGVLLRLRRYASRTPVQAAENAKS
jgi:hypothetical protein